MKGKITHFLKNNWVLIAILLIGLFFRIYKLLPFYMYGHDQDLAGWIVKDILVNGHLRLIGQETSSQGIFIGPLFYYLLIPFYLVTKMDSSGTLILVTLLGLVTVFSFYFVFAKMFGKRVGLIAAFLYAVIPYLVFTDREVVPTMPVYLWCIWFFYGLWFLLQGKQKVYFLLGILLGIAWNFSLALVVLAPLILLAQVMSEKKLNFRYVFIGIVLFVITFSPYLIFEVRHSFRQTRAILASETTSKDYVAGTSRGLAKLDRVFQLVRKNTATLVWTNSGETPYRITVYLFIAAFVFLVVKKLIPKKVAVIMVVWQILYLVFFTVNSINPSEYYLNGMNVVWLVIFSVFVAYLCKQKVVGFIVLVFLASLNLKNLLERPVNHSGYLERKAIVSYIKADAESHGYPCISVSYITSPGYNLGYRYFFWLSEMHVNLPKSGSPVYSIVFPLSMVDRTDKTFGALGLILPEYKKYTESKVAQSCQGENANLVEPMGGYTE